MVNHHSLSHPNLWLRDHVVQIALGLQAHLERVSLPLLRPCSQSLHKPAAILLLGMLTIQAAFANRFAAQQTNNPLHGHAVENRQGVAAKMGYMGRELE